MKLLSFVGTGNLKETSYCLGSRMKRTAYIQEALCEFYPIDSVVLFTTPAALKKNYSAISNLIPNAKAIQIPDGRDEKEALENFHIGRRAGETTG